METATIWAYVVVRAHPQDGADLSLIKHPGDMLAGGNDGDQYTGLDEFGRIIGAERTF